LIEADDDVVPEAVASALPGARLYGESIIALAIEPSSPDALHAYREALGGAGRPAGVIGCDVIGTAIAIELLPSITPFAAVAAILDVESRRFSASRKTTLLAPLSMDVLAAIAAAGLQAPEIAPNRILEALLAHANIE
jgi:hypothetical protein